jgi:hypothetical protein
MMQGTDRAHWAVHTQVRKYAEDIDELGISSAEFERLFTPAEIVDVQGNLLVNAGIQLMMDLLIGAGGTVFSNANARLAVGDSSTAAAAGQTDLQAATNKMRKAMDATFPSRSGQTLTFQSTFGPTDAVWVWNEWAVANSASGATILNRKVEGLGNHTTGTWVLQVTITIS